MAVKRKDQGGTIPWKSRVIFGLLALFVASVLGQSTRYGQKGRNDEKIPYSQ